MKYPLAVAIAAALIGCSHLAPAHGRPDVSAADVPTFQLRARVATLSGRPPSGKTFTYRFVVPSGTVTSTDAGWSGWLPFGEKEAKATLASYPYTFMHRFPVVVILRISGMADPTSIEVQARLDETGESVNLTGDLFGPLFGILLDREGRRPRLMKMADYNREHYWKVLAGSEVPKASRPSKFTFVERYVSFDNERQNWDEGFQHLADAGFNTLLVPPSRPLRELLARAGIRRVAQGVYSPPGYAFDYEPKLTPADLGKWAGGQAKAYVDAGFSPRDLGLFVMSDEPGWNYPQLLGMVGKNAVVLDRFHAYLKAQGLTPNDVGASDWVQVKPIGLSKATDLPSRRLFYWSMRFFPWDSARFFSECTHALETAFYPGLPVITNWNNFNGRGYLAGPGQHNPDPSSPDAGFGSHNWQEFGRMRGGTMLWTEDWFADGKAYQWSFYCAKLRSAAAKQGLQFGGYVIPRTSGNMPDGIIQRILCIVGSGGKAVYDYMFGPEYSFPGNCYSDFHPEILRKIAQAHRMVGAAEDLLWAGKRPRAQVAILVPQSAPIWDVRGRPVPNQLLESYDLNRATTDYMAEVADLYMALQHAAIPVDFVTEDDLNPSSLKPYRVLYVTAPNIPAEGQRGLVGWVKAGGALVTVPGAGARDRYDEPGGVLQDASGVSQEAPARLTFPNLGALPPAGKIRTPKGDVAAWGARGMLKGTVEASPEVAFADGSPALASRPVGRGRITHFSWFPGLSYAKSANWGTFQQPPTGFDERIRDQILEPVRAARVQAPATVDASMVETPILLSAQGAAVTLLNWTGSALPRARIEVRVPFAARSVVSVTRGPLSFRTAGGAVQFALPLGGADIVLIRPESRKAPASAPGPG